MSGGVLYVVATPIGNLADWSPRAVDSATPHREPDPRWSWACRRRVIHSVRPRRIHRSPTTTEQTSDAATRARATCGASGNATIASS